MGIVKLSMRPEWDGGGAGVAVRRAAVGYFWDIERLGKRSLHLCLFKPASPPRAEGTVPLHITVTLEDDPAQPPPLDSTPTT